MQGQQIDWLAHPKKFNCRIHTGSNLEGAVTWLEHSRKSQEWTVPATGEYIILAVGADGGTGDNGNINEMV